MWTGLKVFFIKLNFRFSKRNPWIIPRNFQTFTSNKSNKSIHRSIHLVPFLLTITHLPFNYLLLFCILSERNFEDAIELEKIDWTGKHLPIAIYFASSMWWNWKRSSHSKKIFDCPGRSAYTQRGGFFMLQ